ncbi:MAG: hypothetical protein M3R51_01545 [Candidatus Eremiobacteraeota bacterium]|nr:hypothetical protein [Candidatus Eremiobacteraeota bacterium]
MIHASLVFALVGATSVAQSAPAASLAFAPALSCLDSPHAVPQPLLAPALPSMQIVRIDKVVSTAPMLQNEVIGYLYTVRDGSTWLGQRSPDYMSAADAAAVNQVLASTHIPAQNITAFPAQSKLGIATKSQQVFKINLPSAASEALRIQVLPCVAWPAGVALPTPAASKGDSALHRN